VQHALPRGIMLPQTMLPQGNARCGVSRFEKNLRRPSHPRNAVNHVVSSTSRFLVAISGTASAFSLLHHQPALTPHSLPTSDFRKRPGPDGDNNRGCSFMKTTFARLWNEEVGAIVSAEIMLIGTILVLGMIVGLKSVRDSVVTELADVAQAVANVNQSYSFSGVTGHGAFSGGGNFGDAMDFCDSNSYPYNNSQESKCVNVAAYAASEN